MVDASATPNDEPPQAPQGASRGLRIAVWAMGAAIVLMFALIGLGLALGWHKRDRSTASAAPIVRSGEAPVLDLAVAPEARLYTLAGDGSRIALHVAAPSGDEIVIVDSASAQVVLRIRLTPAGAASQVPPPRP